MPPTFKYHAKPGSGAPYFTDGKLYNAVEAQGAGWFVLDDHRNRRFIIPGPTAHCRPRPYWGGPEDPQPSFEEIR